MKWFSVIIRFSLLIIILTFIFINISTLFLLKKSTSIVSPRKMYLAVFSSDDCSPRSGILFVKIYSVRSNGSMFEVRLECVGDSLASAHHRWHAYWENEDAVVLESTDIGRVRWTRSTKGVWSKSPNGGSMEDWVPVTRIE
jgi:hypothetical protein